MTPSDEIRAGFRWDPCSYTCAKSQCIAWCPVGCQLVCGKQGQISKLSLGDGQLNTVGCICVHSESQRGLLHPAFPRFIYQDLFSPFPQESVGCCFSFTLSPHWLLSAFSWLSICNAGTSTWRYKSLPLVPQHFPWFCWFEPEKQSLKWVLHIFCTRGSGEHVGSHPRNVHEDDPQNHRFPLPLWSSTFLFSRMTHEKVSLLKTT